MRGAGGADRHSRFLSSVGRFPSFSLADGRRVRGRRQGEYVRQFVDRLDALELTARDGTHLRAWLFTPAATSGRSVLVLHGQASNRAGMLRYIDMLLSVGLQVLAPDARAHGDSEGSIASYGVVESGDARQWANLLRERNGRGCVYGFAESMGAGTLLQSLQSS